MPTPVELGSVMNNTGDFGAKISNAIAFKANLNREQEAAARELQALKAVFEPLKKAAEAQVA